MVCDSALAEFGGLVEWTGDVTLRDYFGAVNHHGEMTKGIYFYVYPDSSDSIIVFPNDDPDVVLYTENAGNVFLWKVEE